jgi:hypothetical protein
VDSFRKRLVNVARSLSDQLSQLLMQLAFADLGELSDPTEHRQIHSHLLCLNHAAKALAPVLDLLGVRAMPPIDAYAYGMQISPPPGTGKQISVAISPTSCRSSNKFDSCREAPACRSYSFRYRTGLPKQGTFTSSEGVSELDRPCRTCP